MASLATRAMTPAHPSNILRPCGASGLIQTKRQSRVFCAYAATPSTRRRPYSLELSVNNAIFIGDDYIMTAARKASTTYGSLNFIFPN